MDVDASENYSLTSFETSPLSEWPRLIREIFCDPNTLYSSFLTLGARIGAVMDEESSGVDLPSLRKTYELLYENPETPSSIRSDLVEATEMCARELKHFLSPSPPRERLRVVLMLLENPILLEPAYQNTTTGPIINQIAMLDERSRKTISIWFSIFPVNRFQRILYTIQHFISVQWFLVPGYDERIVNGVRTLGILNDTNEVSEIVPASSFYNDAVNEMDIRQLLDDYHEWRRANHNGSEKFSFCGHPFVLDPAAKSQILRIESLEAQENIARQAMMFGFIRGEVHPYLVLKVHRENLVFTALNELLSHVDDIRKPLKVIFVGEEGIDAGGVQKEFFQLIVREIFDPKFGMFVYNEDTRTYWFSSDSLETEDEFQLIGMILGLAIYNHVILDIHFPPVAYKKLVNRTVTLADMIETDPIVGRSLTRLLEYDGDVENDLCLNFTLTKEVYGEARSIELKPNGGSIPVTAENRSEYVRLYVEYILEKSIETQFRAFQRGFERVVSGPVLRMFRPNELELLVCGSRDLDFDALAKAAQYQDGYEKNSKIVQWLWEVLSELPQEEKKRFLQFVTGSDRAPINGLGSLIIIISRGGPDSEILPSSHTCFNHLLIPEYSSKDKLRRKLLLAIDNAEGFGLM